MRYLVLVLLVAIGAGPRGASAATLVHEGLTSESLGGATLGLDPLGRLVVSNLGPSGDDGVLTRIPHGASGVTYHWEQVAGQPIAWDWEIEAEGVVGVELGSLEVLDLNLDGVLDVAATFLDDGPISIAVLNDDVLVGELTVANGHHVTIEPLSPVPLTSGKIRAWSDSPTAHAFQLGFDAPMRCMVTGAAQMDGNAVRVRCANRTYRAGVRYYEFRARTDPGGGGGGSFAIKDQGVQVHDADVRARGGAHFQIPGLESGVEIENIGASRQDGVTIGPEPGRGDMSRLQMSVHVLDPPPAAVDYLLEIDGIGTMDGNSDQTLGGLDLALVGDDEIDVTPHFRTFDGLHYHYQVLDGGTPVGDFYGQTGSIGMPHVPFAYEIRIGPTGAPQYRIVCITDPCPTFLINGLPFSGDELLVEPENLPPGTTVNGIHEVRAIAINVPGVRFWDIEYSPLSPTLSAGGSPSPPSLAIGRVWPNPAPARVSVELTLAASGPVRADIVDLAGRRVRRLGGERLAAGSHRLEWDGRDECGNPASNGIYFVSVASSGAVRTARFALAR